ncbi:hypothetical protein vseg_002923 [Gypsophila vaccaria]
MPPTKRKASGNGNVSNADGVVAVVAERRVTRGQTRQLLNNSGGGLATQPPPKKAKKPKKAVNKTTPNKAETTTALQVDVQNDNNKNNINGSKGPTTPTVVIEHCKQCNRFKVRAQQVQKGLEESIPGITVLINPEKPRRGCFEIRQEGGQTFISLLDLKRPFKPMTDLNMEEVIADIIGKIKA